MPNPVVTVGEGGVAIPRSAEDAELLGSVVQDPAIAEGQAYAAARRRMFDTTDYKLSTLAEGVVDAFTAGLVRETGDVADERREALSGYSFAGQAIGTALGLVTGVGPTARVNAVGETVGKIAAQGVLRQGEKAIVTTTLREAGAGAALTGATSFGHQLMDTVLEDREFSGAAIVDDMKLGGLIGGVGGGLMGTFGKLAGRATRADVATAGAGADMAEALAHQEAARAAYGEALHFHEQQLGAIKELRRVGKLGDVSDDFIRVRSDAIREARAAQKALKELDVEAALSGSDPAAYKEFQRSWTRYERAVESVDDIMRPHSAELSHVQAAREPGTGIYPVTRLADDDLIPVVRGGEDFVVPAREVAEAIPDEAAYLSRYKSSIEAEVPPAKFPEGTPATSAQRPEAMRAAPANDLAALDEAIKQLPMRTGSENAQVFATGIERLGDNTVVESVPRGQVAKQLEAAEAAEPTRVQAPKPMPDEVANRLLDDWAQLSEPRVRPWAEAQARARASMEELYQKSGGRMDSARSLGILEADRIAPTDSPVGSYFDSIYSMNRASRFVADEARGMATPLRAAGKAAVLAAIGAKVLGTKNMALVMGFLGYGGRVAAATGRMARNIVDSVASFMSSTKVRSIAVAAGNHPWAYSERGPIKDPVERIQEIQFLAANPDAIRARVRAQAGPLFAAAPEHVAALENQAVNQITSLAVRAPAIYWDRLGRPLTPPQGKLRQFFEYENAINDLDAILKSLSTGSITKPQVDALQTGWPAVHVRVAQGMLADPGKLQTFDRAKLRVVEMVTGMPLTGGSDPMFLARQQAAWQAVAVQAPAAAFKPQAFNINPDGAPTPSQANASGRAPGN